MKLTLTPDEIEWARGLWAIGYDTLAIARRIKRSEPEVASAIEAIKQRRQAA